MRHRLKKVVCCPGLLSPLFKVRICGIFVFVGSLFEIFTHDLKVKAELIIKKSRQRLCVKVLSVLFTNPLKNKGM